MTKLPDKKYWPRPAGWRVLILPIEIEEVTKGGILLPQQAVDQKEFAQMCGEILAIGPLAWTRSDMGGEDWANVGDYVLFGKYEGKKVRVDDVDMLLMNDDCIVAVIPDPTKIT
jgi:co-chaperonin GroES (HSP10)